MTRAPANLLAVRSLLLTHLNVDPKTVRDADLEPAEVGIVGDPAHRGGYHCGSDRVVTNDYSVVESSRDRNGLTLDAAALDVGGFSVRSGGRTHTLPSFSLWCVGQCAANAADTRDIREIIYSPDGTTVKRWDRLGKRTSGDSSHRWHTHFSFFRDAIKAGRDQRPLFRRYLTSIGLIEVAPTPPMEDPEMELSDRLKRDTGRPQRTVDDVLADLSNLRNWLVSAPNSPGVVDGPAPNSPLAALLAAAGRPAVDVPALATEVLRVLTPQAIADAIPASLAKEVADELARRLVA
ncbi:hypothetical protein [Micromonospora sp. MH99]|uniref:hypothetical protein n=1 Tax=Micromonospora sp. MH99 TaxID=1945510 RepID=UPI001F3762F9|nr:hypothetical protein [Micromonospora sp. MH99]MCF0094519.1 hypothetical protein [Micromonospora sp. MH99]